MNEENTNQCRIKEMAKGRRAHPLLDDLARLEIQGEDLGGVVAVQHQEPGVRVMEHDLGERQRARRGDAVREEQKKIIFWDSHDFLGNSFLNNNED